MFRIFFTLLILGFCLRATADAPKIMVAHADDTPTVQATGKLLRIQAPSAENTENTPPGTLAARIAVPHTLFEWTPSPAPGRVTGGADIVTAAISPDESILVVAERIGGNGPNSTRLLFFNLHNHKLIHSIELERRKLADLAFSPTGGDTLWAVEARQDALQLPARLIGINLLNGNVQYESSPLENDPAGFAAGKTHLWVTLAGTESFLQFNPNAPEQSALKTRSRIAGAKLQLSPDGNTLLLLGPGRVERFRVADAQIEYLGNAPLPGDYHPELVIPVADDGSGFAIAAPGKPAYLIAGGAARKLDDESGRTGCFRRQEGELLMAVLPQEAIRLYPANSATAAASVSPGKLRPFNKNENLKLFALSGEKREILLIDHRGNISRLEIRPRRWEKTMIFEVSE